MKLYKFSQNNSGGWFDTENGMDYDVWVEASTYEEANDRAEQIGIYFDGCSSGIDCACCGDRWYALYDENPGEEYYELEGEDQQSLVEKLQSQSGIMFRTHSTVHWVDGTQQRIGYK